MLPISHGVPIDPSGLRQIPDPRTLADAFSEFISASSFLESSYRDLQKEVAQLSAELASRNADLTQSLDENRRMRNALQQILDSMPCGVLVLTRDQEIVMVNPEASRLLGLKDLQVADLRELSISSRVDFTKLAHGAGAESSWEIVMESSGVRRWLSIGSKRLQTGNDNCGEPAKQLHSIWILRDITWAKQAELEREAARRATTLAEISTILAHEIRNPLASLELFTELIEQEPLEISQWVAHLRAGIRTLSGTVNNVLSLYGDAKPQLGPLDLVSCVSSGVEFVRPLADQSGITLTFKSVGDHPTILANPDAIRQIILNLVRNAIRFTIEGGQVNVVVDTIANDDRSIALVKVSDTGSGMTADTLKHIFEAGFSGTGETPGLGLTVCKRLMAQLGGEIKATSQLGVGTTFYLEFPIL